MSRQPVGKTTGVGGEGRGYDGPGKKRAKRHLLVDTQGLVLAAKVHATSVFERDGIKSLLDGARERSPRISHLWLDAGYEGKGKGKDRVEKVLGWDGADRRASQEVGQGARGRGAAAVPEGFSSCCPGGRWWNAPSCGWGRTAGQISHRGGRAQSIA
jgi:hypothetical protein